jgi:hypothetical protein
MKIYTNDEIYCQDRCVNMIYKTLQYSPLFITRHIICKHRSLLSVIPAREMCGYLLLDDSHFLEFVRHDGKSEKSDY